jgi:hypothetical protein
MKKEQDKWIFSTGRYITTAGCVTGDPESLRLYEGYDHELGLNNPDGTSSYELSPQELVELADAMIELWGEFKANAQKPDR